MRVYLNISRFRIVGPFENWIRRIFYNVCNEYYRQNKIMFKVQINEEKHFWKHTIYDPFYCVLNDLHKLIHNYLQDIVQFLNCTKLRDLHTKNSVRWLVYEKEHANSNFPGRGID